MKRRVAQPWWSWFLVWFGGFWYTLGDHDALAPCYLGGFAIGDDFAILEETLFMIP